MCVCNDFHLRGLHPFSLRTSPLALSLEFRGHWKVIPSSHGSDTMCGEPTYSAPGCCPAASFLIADVTLAMWSCRSGRHSGRLQPHKFFDVRITARLPHQHKGPYKITHTPFSPSSLAFVFLKCSLHFEVHHDVEVLCSHRLALLHNDSQLHLAFKHDVLVLGRRQDHRQSYTGSPRRLSISHGLPTSDQHHSNPLRR